MMDANSFWYVYTTNGSNGFLLDLIRRPDSSVARLVLYSKDAPPTVLRQSRDRSALSASNGSLQVKLDDLELTESGCRGALGEIGFDFDYTISPRNIGFVPAWLHRIASYVPSFSSHYGRLSRGTCHQAAYENIPLVYSTYGVGNIAKSKWYLISASQFEGTDLAFEISGARLYGIWGPSAYVYFRGVEYKLNNALFSLFRFRSRRTGQTTDGERVFEVDVRTRTLSMKVRAAAPNDDFAMLEQEGDTQIHTTLFGNCDVALSIRGHGREPEEHRFSARRTCLLEVKHDPE